MLHVVAGIALFISSIFLFVIWYAHRDSADQSSPLTQVDPYSQAVTDGVFIQFNTSSEPFAYIRDDSDLDIFILNVQNALSHSRYHALATPELLEFLWIFAGFFIFECNPSDRRYDRMGSTLNSLQNSFEFESLVSVNEMLAMRYKTLSIQFSDFETNMFFRLKKEALTSLKIVSGEPLLKGLRNDHFPTQACLYSGDVWYEFWFSPTRGEEPYCFLDRDASTKTAIVSLALPAYLFLPQAYGTAPLNMENFRSWLELRKLSLLQTAEDCLSGRTTDFKNLSLF